MSNDITTIFYTTHTRRYIQGEALRREDLSEAAVDFVIEVVVVCTMSIPSQLQINAL